jgi:hypothetical protein
MKKLDKNHASRFDGDNNQQANQIYWCQHGQSLPEQQHRLSR